MPVIAWIVTECVTIKLAGADGDKLSSFWRNFASVASRGACDFEKTNLIRQTV